MNWRLEDLSPEIRAQVEAQTEDEWERAAKRQSDNPEQRLHQVCAQIVMFNVNPKDALVFHVPNGGFRNKKTGGILKSMGVVAGIWDWCVVLRGGQVGFIEMKYGDADLSPAQKAVLRVMEGLGVRYAVCRSSAEFEGTLRAWGALPRASVRAA